MCLWNTGLSSLQVAMQGLIHTRLPFGISVIMWMWTMPVCTNYVIFATKLNLSRLIELFNYSFTLAQFGLKLKSTPMTKFLWKFWNQFQMISVNCSGSPRLNNISTLLAIFPKSNACDFSYPYFSEFPKRNRLLNFTKDSQKCS